MRRGLFHAVVPIIVLAAGIMASSCGGGSSGSNEGASGNSWTYMVYIAADNTLSPYAKIDVNEMETVGSTREVNIVVEADFKYIDPVTTPGVPQTAMRGLVAQDLDTDSMGAWYTEIGERNMADPATLREFITWAAQTYPADHYALVIWSHGMGWKGELGASKGVISDSSLPIMSMPELSGAIRGSHVAFDVINFDACLMGMYEVAYELSGLASYLVFSEEEYPAYGDPYASILTELTLDPSMSGRDLAETITMKTREYYQEANMTVTRSAVDMSAVDDLHAGLCTLAQYLIAHMDATLKAAVEEARSEAFAYDYPTNIDLGDFLRNLRSSEASGAELDSLISGILDGSLPQSIIANEVYKGSADVSSTGIDNSMGIAIYLPSSDPAENQISLVELAVYSGLACNQSPAEASWSDFLNSFLL